MAELDIGKHCTVDDCQQLDFLPIECDGCGKTFCKNHHAYDLHHCSLENKTTDRQEFTGPKSFACTFTGCQQRELTEVICEGCGQRFCLQHRHQVDHKCPKYEAPSDKMQSTKKHVEDLLAEKLSGASEPGKSKTKKPLSKKARATAAKVALMKIKMKAVGDKGIPDTEKLYFLVGLPLGSKEKSKALYVSKKWSVGRVIDQITSMTRVENKNNIPGAKKICLFDAVDGHRLPAEESLEVLLKREDATLFNGSSVILEYVDSDTLQLDTVENYHL